MLVDLRDLGEFGLIERLRAVTGDAPDGELWIGDDTAVLRAPAGTILFTTDVMVEGVHFDLAISSPADIGYKAMAVNISDIAAMGGTPRRATVALGLRPELSVEFVEQLYDGLVECASQFDAAVTGGDVSASGCFFLSVALIGNPAGRVVITRSGARPGDLIGVTGVLGRSAAGYRLLRAGSRDRADLLQAHLRPQARVRETETLRRFLPSAMIDVSDGFAADLGKMCAASGVGARVDGHKLPVPDVNGLDRTPLELALWGGEDYELCFSISPDRAADAAKAVEEATGTAISYVGKVVEETAIFTISLDGETTDMEQKGWNHLS